ncbi:hypothetical protein [Agromyces laixinhei]|uniref:hypothetical protein n=1 Tax=Agromyces laixinhei TaxID=2585717 RepID=UPI00143CC0B9|nr:hypothetical protein [Agromyces laixinhei]
MTAPVPAPETVAEAAAEATGRADAAAPTPFSMIMGDPSAMVCEGDACYVPGTRPGE